MHLIRKRSTKQKKIASSVVESVHADTDAVRRTCSTRNMMMMKTTTEEEEENTAETSSRDASDSPCADPLTTRTGININIRSNPTVAPTQPVSALKVRTLSDSLVQCDARRLAEEVKATAIPKTRSEPLLQQQQPQQNLSSSPHPSSRRRRVSFSTLELHAHELVLGDNPSTAVGPPLAIGWTRLHTDTLAIDAFEQHRGERRDRASLVMPCFDRERELIGWGFSRSEMRDAQDALEKIKLSRAKNATLTLRERLAVRWRYVVLQRKQQQLQRRT